MMNDQTQMMNQSQIMNPPPSLMNPPKMMNPISAPMMNQSQMLSMNQPPPQMLNPPPSQMLNQQQQLKQPQLMNQSQAQQMMMSRGGGGGGGYGMWPPVQEQLSYNQNPSMNFPGFVSKPMGRNNWKGKKGINDNKRNDMRRKGKPVIASGNTSATGGGGGYKPPTLKELQQENRLKARKYFQKKKYDKFNNNRSAPFTSRNTTSAPFAPRNTSSFIIRAKRSGGIASLVSPCPVTPAVLPTPMFSPSREVLVDTAKEEWGVDGYGSMNGLIRLRSPGNEADVMEDDDEEEGGGSSDSDVEEHLEVERRLSHDLSRFEMISPNHGVEYNNVLGNRVDDQDSHIAQVEEENSILKDRLSLMERELTDLRRRLLSLERQHQGIEETNEEVVENESGNENESRGGYSRLLEENNEEVTEENEEVGEQYLEAKEENANVDEIVKDMKNVESKEENNNRDLKVNDGNYVDTEVENGNANVEDKEVAASSETLNDAVVRDVCMKEIAHKQDNFIAGVAKLLDQE